MAPPPATLRGPLGALLLAGLLALALRWRDPHRAGSWGLCPWRLLTGWDCPGCGGLRAVNDLDHGHLGAAWHSNALAVASLPLAAVLWAAWVGLRLGRRPVRLSPRLLSVVAASYALLALAFAIYRNTPWGAWSRAD